MGVFTNSQKFGGDFLKCLENRLSKATHAKIAVGYTSAEIVSRITPEAFRIADRGGSFQLLVGTAFFEGLSSPNYQSLQFLHSGLTKKNRQSCGVRFSIDVLYHGKIYYFSNGGESIYAGSSNLSQAGLQGNYEFMSEILGKDFTQAKNYLQFLLTDGESATIDRIQDLTIFDTPEYKNIIQPKLDDVNTHQENINLKGRKFIEIPLGDMDQKQRSGLNACFGKGRLIRKTGKISPRPWFEIEVISGASVSSSSLYPKGEFEVLTDDGYKFACKTSGDYFKNFRSKNDLQLLGKWIKGKLQNKGVLSAFSPITNETLLRYGKNSIKLYPLGNRNYFLEF